MHIISESLTVLFSFYFFFLFFGPLKFVDLGFYSIFSLFPRFAFFFSMSFTRMNKQTELNQNKTKKFEIVKYSRNLTAPNTSKQYKHICDASKSARNPICQRKKKKKYEKKLKQKFYSMIIMLRTKLSHWIESGFFVVPLIIFNFLLQTSEKRKL